MAGDERLLQAVEIGSLALGSTLIAFPNAVVKVSGLDQTESGAPMFLRTIGFWATGFGALLQVVDDDDERERLLLAAGSVAAASVVEGFISATKKRTPWRAAVSQMVLAGSLAGAAFAYVYG